MELKAGQPIGLVWPENYFIEDDDMPESDVQYHLLSYLASVLSYLFQLQGWYVGVNLLIVQPGYGPITPDLMLCFVRLTEEARYVLKSWNMADANRPAPAVVFEVGSEGTWEKDLGEKVVRYGQLGVKEYYTFDPNVPKVWRKISGRLLGWRYEDGEPIPLSINEQGRIWSDALECYLEENDTKLKLYNRQGELCLTQAEAERQARLVAEQERETERQARLMAEQQSRLEAQRRNLAEQERETERQARLIAEQQAAQQALEIERLKALLGQQGLDKNIDEQ